MFGQTLLALMLMAQPEGDARVEGTVVDPAGWPLAGARVELRRGPRVHTTYSDQRGRFVLERLPPGPWTLRAMAPLLPPAVELLFLVPSTRIERRLQLPRPELARISVRVRETAPVPRSGSANLRELAVDLTCNAGYWLRGRR